MLYHNVWLIRGFSIQHFQVILEHNFSYYSTENEYKLLLLWHKIMQLANRQVDFPGAQLNSVVKQLTFFVSRLHTLAEDKESSGLLGAIGLGKKSPLSRKYVNFIRSFSRQMKYSFNLTLSVPVSYQQPTSPYIL